MQGGNLLRHDTDQEGKQRRHKQHGTHVGEASPVVIGVAVVGQASQEQGRADGQEKTHGRKQGADLDDNDQEAKTIVKQPYMTFSVSAPVQGLDRDIADRQPRTKEGHGAGRRV